MSMKKFYVGVKAVIQDERGILLIKHMNGFWDMPGGRIDDNEDFETALRRELSEELAGSTVKFIGEQLGAARVHRDIKDDISLVLIFFKVGIDIPEGTLMGDEHTEHLWITSLEQIPEPINPVMKAIVLKELK